MGDTDAESIDTGTSLLLGERRNGVATLTLNRPERRNALHAEIFDNIGTVLGRLATDDTVGALVLTGAGSSFCAGGDVAAQSQRAEAAAKGATASIESTVADLRRRQNEFSAALHEFPKVTIAALPGAAAGAGLSLALACDLRIASDTAFVTTAFAKVGFSGDFGGSWYLTQLLGAAKARELYLTSDRVSASEALRLGLFNRVVPAAELAVETQRWAETFAAGPTVAYQLMKENLNRALVADLRTCLDAEAVNMTRTGRTEDHREAAKAFLEKRSPTFHGR